MLGIGPPLPPSPPSRLHVVLVPPCPPFDVLRAPEPQKPARPGVAFNPVGTLFKATKAKKGDPS
jgi:hypothetical protein